MPARYLAIPVDETTTGLGTQALRKLRIFPPTPPDFVPLSCAAQQLLLVENRFSAESANHESREWPSRGDFGDNHRGCDIRNDAVLDAVHFVDGIFIVARAA